MQSTIMLTHARMHARTHTHIHTHTRTRTHTHTPDDFKSVLASNPDLLLTCRSVGRGPSVSYGELLEQHAAAAKERYDTYER